MTCIELGVRKIACVLYFFLLYFFEARHFPMDLPDPVEAIKFEMEREGLTVKDLEPMIGKSNRVYEILNHKR